MTRRCGTMSRDEVVQSERRAWTEDHESARLYFYDGINFWYRRGRSEPQQVPIWSAPRGGWRHREDCRCTRCRSQTLIGSIG